MLIFTTDKNRLLKHFRKDPVLFAYHIGDLDDFHFPDCLWSTLVSKRAGINDVLLTYTGGDTPTVLAFGLSDDFDNLLNEYVPIAPPRFFCHFRKQHRPIFREFANETPLGTHLKMRLDETMFASRRPTRSTGVIRLDHSHEPALRELYSAAYPGNYFAPRMLQTGKYFGYVENGAIIAVAGVHVVSDRHRIAVLGNIATHREYRGRGLATTLTYQLTEELVSEGKLVCLNVKADNVPAITCYRKLGFVPVHEFEEALFKLR